MQQPPRAPKLPDGKKRKTGQESASLLHSRTGYDNANAKPLEVRERFLEGYERTCGNVAASCRYAGIDRRTFYRWKSGTSAADKEFQLSLELIKPAERLLDLAEAALVERIQAGETKAIIYALRTRGRSRGWSERPSDVKNEREQLEEQIVGVMRKIAQRAQMKGVEFKSELRNFLEIMGDEVKPEIRQRFSAELEKLG